MTVVSRGTTVTPTPLPSAVVNATPTVQPTDAPTAQPTNGSTPIQTPTATPTIAPTTTPSPSASSGVRETIYGYNVTYPEFAAGYDVNPNPKYVAHVDELYSSPGTYHFTIPTGVTSIEVTLIGGGGGGGGGNDGSVSAYGGAGGAGGSGYYVTTQITVHPGQVCEIIVGAGGNGGAPHNFRVASG